MGTTPIILLITLFLRPPDNTFDTEEITTLAQQHNLVVTDLISTAAFIWNAPPILVSCCGRS
jgi:hypothetical protein